MRDRTVDCDLRKGRERVGSMLRNGFTVTTAIPGPEMFRRSPFHSYYFISLTILMVLGFLGSIAVWLRFGAELSWISKAWTMVACSGMIMLWLRAVRDWNRIREILPKEIQSGTALSTATAVAAAQLFYGLFYCFFLVGSLILAIGRAVGDAVNH
jgi:hypothetical protein